jgi:hypothetical protein
MLIKYRINVEYILSGILNGAVLRAYEGFYFRYVYNTFIKGNEQLPEVDCGDYCWWRNKKILIQKALVTDPYFKQFNEPFGARKLWVSFGVPLDEDSMPPTIMMPQKLYCFQVALNDPSDSRNHYAAVETADEETPFEAIAVHYKYRYNKAANRYVRLSDLEIKKNLCRFLIEDKFYYALGQSSPLDRIADYDKVICFLLQKAQGLLSEEEKSALSCFLSRDIQLEVLAKINEREGKTAALVQRFNNADTDLAYKLYKETD